MGHYASEMNNPPPRDYGTERAELLKLADQIAQTPLTKDWTAQLHPPERQSVFDYVVLKVSEAERKMIVSALQAQGLSQGQFKT